jgi:hypothetical protein
MTPTRPDADTPADLHLQPPTPEDSPAVTRAVTALVALALFVGLFFLGCDGWLAYKVPVSTQDLRDASWFFSYTPTDYFSSVVGTAFALGVLAVGLVLGLVRNSAVYGLLGVICALCLHGLSLPSVQFRQSAGAGTAKIGCYVWDSRECKSMLGVRFDNAPSMYLPRAEADKSGEIYTAWYLKAREGLVSSTLQAAAPFLSVPYYAFHPDVLNAKLNAQRAEVARFRASHAAAASTHQ